MTTSSVSFDNLGFSISGRVLEIQGYKLKLDHLLIKDPTACLTFSSIGNHDCHALLEVFNPPIRVVVLFPVLRSADPCELRLILYQAVLNLGVRLLQARRSLGLDFAGQTWDKYL